MATKKKTTKKAAAKKTTTRKAPAQKKAPAKKAAAAKTNGATNGAAAKDPVANVIKTLGGRAFTLVGTETRGDVSEVIPTGIGSLDYHVLGIGGLAVGRASEIYSPEGSGKTSFMLKCLASAQQEGGLAILVETESALDRRWAKEVHGVDVDKLIVIEPDHLEDATELIEKAVNAIPGSVGPNLLAFDSIAATPTQREIEEGLAGKDKVADRAKQMSKACRAFATILKKHRVHLMFINQVRENIGVMFGDQFVTPGGHAVKFLASVRMQILGGKAVKDKHSEHTGKDVTFLCSKNKLYPPWRKAKVRLDYATGWDDDWSTLWLAKEKDLADPRSRDVLEARSKLGWPESEAAL